MTTYYVDGSVGNNINAGTSEGSGNAWATIQKAADTAVAGDIVYVKASADYAEQVDFDTNAGTVNTPIIFEGYTSTTGDGGKFTVTGSGSRASCLVFNGTADYIRFKNIILTSPTTQCVLGTTSNTLGVIFDNFEFLKGSSTPSRGVYAGGYSRFGDWQFYHGIVNEFSTEGLVGFTGRVTIIGCKIINCGGNGITISSYHGGITLINNIIAGNGDDGIFIGASAGPGIIIKNNTIEGNGGDGIDINGSNHLTIVVLNNIIANHSGVGDTGLKVGTVSGTTVLWCNYNIYYNNTTHKSGSHTAGDNDVTLSNDPFTNVSSDNWNLNNTVNGGASCRAQSFDFDGTNIDYSDAGALQHQDSSAINIIKNIFDSIIKKANF